MRVYASVPEVACLPIADFSGYGPQVIPGSIYLLPSVQETPSRSRCIGSSTFNMSAFTWRIFRERNNIFSFLTKQFFSVMSITRSSMLAAPTMRVSIEP